MRRHLWSLVTCLMLFALMLSPLVSTIVEQPAESRATSLSPATPTSPTIDGSTGRSEPVSTLPACIEEDGAGMALCYWDAEHMGNGMGMSVISGDCAPDYVGGQDVSDLCVRLYAMASREVDNGDGSSHTIPNGADRAQECVETNNVMEDEVKESEEFILKNCFEAMISEG